MIAKASEGLSPYKDDPVLIVLIFCAPKIISCLKARTFSFYTPRLRAD